MDFWTGYWTLTAFVFGAVVGSFLNVCIWRLPRNESLSHPPSHCPRCEHQLRFFPDMVPLLSQLWYRSRCRYCGAHFSWRYFWVELFCAVMFAALHWRYSIGAPTDWGDLERTTSEITAMAFAAALITLFFIDLEHYQIPDLCIGVAVLAAVVKDIVLIVRGVRPLWQSIPGTAWEIPLPLSVLGCLFGFWLLWQFAALGTAIMGREAMGGGDSLLLGAMSAFLIPWPLPIAAFVAAVFFGTIGGVAGMAMAGKQLSPGDLAAPADLPDAAGSGEDAGSVDSSESPALTTSSEVTDPDDPERAPDSTKAGLTEADVPPLPADSRIGRIIAVGATWVAVAGVWGAAALAGTQLILGIVSGLAALAVAAWLGRMGARLWVRGDEVWLPAMDELFTDGEPGPRFIPFGPYLVAGTFLVMLFGRGPIEWYVKTQLGFGDISLWPWD